MELFNPTKIGNLSLNNHMVMAPMTRCRAIEHIPNELIATYYGQRASAGLIITEGTSPSKNGIGYTRIPGIYNQDQINGWKLTTEAVHQKGGKIFIQLMHTGRASHPFNMPDDATIMAPSPIALAGEQMYTDKEGPQDYPTPKEMTIDDINATIEEYVQASKNAIEAGFDGVELHGANGYLIDQFINPTTNQRSDNYGGSSENRNRFAIEVSRKVAEAIGADKVGIRLSPYGAFNGMKPYDETEVQYSALAKELGALNLLYIHIVDHSAMGAPEVKLSTKESIRDNFGSTIILSGGYNAERAEKDLKEGLGHLVAFGRPFIANPDLVERFKASEQLETPDHNTFYTPGAEGYTDYPTLAMKEN